MKTGNIIGISVAVVLAVAGTAWADFVLSSSEHLDITSSHSTGVLWDSSTADVLAGGSIGAAYVNDEAVLRIPKLGGWAYDLYAYDSSSVDIAGGGVHYYLYAYDTSTVDISGGNIYYLEAYNTISVDISGGSVFDLEAYNTTSVDISGSGSVTYLDAYDTSTVNISGEGIFSCVSTHDSSSVDIAGGSFSNLCARDTSNIALHGYDFRTTGGLVLDGEEVLGTGILTGKWFDGTSWILTVNTNAPDATILAIPEPATLLLICGAAAPVLLKRRRS